MTVPDPTDQLSLEHPMDVCVIGAGPRGLSVVERICANVAAARTAAFDAVLTVHLVDPHPPGAGAVWRTDQHRVLLMNTVASQVSLFTDRSVQMAGPLRGGPSMYDWARLLAMLDPTEEYDAAVLAEARRLGPDDYPTRALYGQYLRWVFRHVAVRAGEQVRLLVHPSPAVALDDPEPGGPQTVLLADGTRLDGLHAVILAQGHLPNEPSAGQRRLRRFADGHRLRYLPPGNPADADLAAIAPGEPVAVRGLGLCFFDHLALLTEGRGGGYERHGDGLVYRPSGAEPRLMAGSRRGIPYHARGENEKGVAERHEPLLLTPSALASLTARRPLDFRRDVWPLIAREVEAVYYGTLLARRDGVEPDRFRREYARHPDPAARAALLTSVGIEPARWWDWSRVARPYEGQRFDGPAAFRSWLLGYLREDVAAAREGNVSGPVKAALDVLRDLRNEVRLLVEHGGLTGRSHREDLDGWYTPLNAFLSIGPPARRIEEMIALIEAGVLTVVGPGATVDLDGRAGAFVLSSPAVPGSPVPATTLVDAWLPEPDLRRTIDPLLRHLRATGQCRPYRIDGPDGEWHETGGLAVTRRPYRVVDAAGRPHERRFAFGVPTESVHWVTAAGIRPGVNSMTLGDADAVARAVLSLPALDICAAVRR
jgi:uncharacterized NAD(P)/FAD-binding protein YdhS